MEYEAAAAQTAQAQAELDRAARRVRRGLLAVALFSAVVNVLMFTGPLYMLQVYDRVLGAGSVETLVALSGLAIFLFAAMGQPEASIDWLLYWQALALIFVELPGPGEEFVGDALVGVMLVG